MLNTTKTASVDDYKVTYEKNNCLIHTVINYVFIFIAIFINAYF